MAEVKALACQLPATLGLPLSRFSRNELRRHVLEQGIVAEISGTTIWRWLSEDAIRPWSYRTWLFPRDPDFAAKAGRVLDLYEGFWQGKALAKRDFVLSADEKAGLQIRKRRHASSPPQARQSQRVEHEYRRRGTCAYQCQNFRPGVLVAPYGLYSGRRTITSRPGPAARYCWASVNAT